METLMAYVIISCDFLKDVNVRINEMKMEKGNHVTWSHNFNMELGWGGPDVFVERVWWRYQKMDGGIQNGMTLQWGSGGMFGPKHDQVDWWKGITSWSLECIECCSNCEQMWGMICALCPEDDRMVLLPNEVGSLTTMNCDLVTPEISKKKPVYLGYCKRKIKLD